jgi:hypothetical protein
VDGILLTGEPDYDEKVNNRMSHQRSIESDDSMSVTKELLSHPMTSDKLLSLSEAHSSHLLNEYYKGMYFTRLS